MKKNAPKKVVAISTVAVVALAGISAVSILSLAKSGTEAANGVENVDVNAATGKVVVREDAVETPVVLDVVNAEDQISYSYEEDVPGYAQDEVVAVDTELAVVSSVVEEVASPETVPVIAAVQNTEVSEITALAANAQTVELAVVNTEPIFAAPAEEPVYEEPVYEETVEVVPAAEEVIQEVPEAEAPVQEEPVVQQPAAEELVVEKPVVEEPVAEVPAEEPVAEVPAEELVVEAPVVEAPAPAEPVVEAPVVEAVVPEEPVYEEPVYEEPVVEAVVPEEPVVEAPVVEAAVPEEPVYVEPVYEESVAEVAVTEDLNTSEETSSSTVNTGTTSSLRQDLVDFAASRVGVTPYVWAGNSLETGTDCSGFVNLIYDSFGMYASSGSSDYQNVEGGWGENISYDELQPGDVVVYYDGGHVGIYGGQDEDGNDIVIHDSNEIDGVKVSYMDYNTPTAYVRIIDDEDVTNYEGTGASYDEYTEDVSYDEYSEEDSYYAYDESEESDEDIDDQGDGTDDDYDDEEWYE